MAALAGAGVGLAGVCLMLSTGTARVDAAGVAASVAAMVMSSFGYVLAKRWGGDVDVLASTSWQLIAGGVTLLTVAAAAEGRPPALDPAAAVGFAYVSVVATAVAFAAWFTGLRHLPAGTVGLIGLLNPVTGVLLGTVLASEVLTLQQGCGIALVFVGIVAGQTAYSRRTARRTVAARMDRLPPSSSMPRCLHRRPRHTKEPEMILKDKVAVIYGAGGAVGGAVARAFATEGANVFLTGRSLASVRLWPATSCRPAGPPRRRRSTRSTNRRSTSTSSGWSRRRAASTSRSTPSASPVAIGGRGSTAQGSWVCRSSSWTSSTSHRRSRPTSRRTS